MSSKNEPRVDYFGRMRIGQLSNLLQVSTKTIRHYHKLGLMPKAARSEKGYRLYNVADLYRMKLILRLKEVGFPLVEIGEILHAEDPDTALKIQIETLARDLTFQIEELNRQLQRVHNLMETKVTLQQVRRPEIDDPYIAEILEEITTIYPEDVSEFAQKIDKRLLSRLEDFNWGADLRDYWRTTAKALSSEDEYLTLLSYHFNQCEHLEADDPRLEAMAYEIASVIDPPSPLPEAPSMDQPVQAAFQQVLSDSIREVLNPAQLHLLELIHRQLHSDEKPLTNP